MKFASALFAAALLCSAAIAGAQQPADIPAPKCEKPQMPGSRMMEDRTIRTRFERDMKAHGDCVKAYVEERNAAAKSHAEAVKSNNEAAKKAVEEYNAFLKSINDAARQ